MVSWILLLKELASDVGKTSEFTVEVCNPIFFIFTYQFVYLWMYFCCSGVTKDSTSKLHFYSAWQNMCQIFTQLKWTPWWRNKKKWSRQQYYTLWNVICLGRTQIYSWRNYNRVEPPSSVERYSKEGRQHTLAGKDEGVLSSCSHLR